MTIEEMYSFLNALGTLGLLKKHAMPDEPDEVGCIYEYPGQHPEGRFGVVGIGYEKPALQIMFRGAPLDPVTPRTKAEIAYRALAAIQPGPQSGVQYLTVTPQQAPFAIQLRDEKNRHRFGFNVYLYKEPS